MNNDEICFFIFSESDAGFEECRKRIAELSIPEGMRVLCANLRVDQGNVLSAAQQAMDSVPSRYKVYLWQDTWILKKDFLPCAIQFFREHPDYGLMGVCGARIGNGDFSDFQMLGAAYEIVGQRMERVMHRNDDAACMEADAVHGMLLMTQYDVPWRKLLFSSDTVFAVSQSMEFRRRGHRVGVFPQKDPWCIWGRPEDALMPSDDDRELLAAEYGTDMTDGINPIWKSYHYHPEIEAGLDHAKLLIGKDISQGMLEQAARRILMLAKVMYQYNQSYTDDYLEHWMQHIEAAWGKRWEGRDYDAEQETVLFYDGFGFDTRGLTQIYLDALGEAGHHILYVAEARRARGRIPVLEALLKKYGAEVVYLPDPRGMWDAYQSICEVIHVHRPARGFLYTWPDDVPGLLAFMHFAGKMRRYQVNLTDHAFWLGRNAFDHCLEFRDYGAAISSHFRRIPREKLAYMPFYPEINKAIPFQGYPFQRDAKDFVIFSGGNLYKTMDKKGTYYRIVDRILEKHPQVKFWYAGYGDNEAPLKELLERWPNRAFYTPERKDLFAVLQHADMYLNTHPIGGGLMVQYSAAAGKVPMSLDYSGEIAGLLLNQDSLGFVFHEETVFLEAVSRFIEDAAYRESLEKNMAASVPVRSDFRQRMKKILQMPEAYAVTPPLPDTALFRQEYLERFLKDNGIDTRNGDA